MKKFNDFIKEVQSSISIEEIESAADLFDFGIDRGCYTMNQARQFNEVFWNVKNRLITKEIYKLNPKTNYLNLLAIVTDASPNIKKDKKKLVQYINERLRSLKNNNKKLA